MFDKMAIGTCSLCGGRVVVDSVHMSVVPPTPTCERCGAVKAEHGPVIDMTPAPVATREWPTLSNSTTGRRW